MHGKKKLEIKKGLAEGDKRFKLVKPPAHLRSNIWQHFDLIEIDGKVQNCVLCKKCKELISYFPKHGTGNMRRHTSNHKNTPRKITSKRRSDATPKKVRDEAASQATFDPLKLVQNGTTPQDLCTVPNLYEEKSRGGCDIDSRNRNNGEACDNTSSASVQHDSNDTDNCVHSYNDDIEYQIKTEFNEVDSDCDIDDDMDDADADDDDQIPVDDVHCNDEDVTTSNFNLMELLMQSNEGQNALSYYDLHNHLNVKHREIVFNTLINIINSDSESQKYNENLRRISYALRQLFPKENYSTLELHKYSMRLEMGETSQQEDFKLYNLLNSWSLAHLYDHFRAENITFDVVKIMETKHIYRLFKNLTIGDNVLFDYHFHKWLENGLPEPLIDVNLNPQYEVFSTSQNGSCLHEKVHDKRGQDCEQLQTLSENEELDIETHMAKTVIETKQDQQPKQSKQTTTTATNGTSRNVRISDRANFDEENILRAIKSIHFKMHSLACAARVFHIPRGTLQRYMSKLSINQDISKLNDDQLIEIIKGYSYTACTATRVFTDKEEKSLVAYIKHFCDHHHTLTLNELREFAYKFAKENNSNYPESWDSEKCAGKSWCYGFMRRHQNLSLRTPEQTTLDQQGLLFRLDPEFEEL